MDPHFLFNALNTLAALTTIAPREIPRAAGRLRQFLRAGFDQHERLLIPLEEELAVVRAYLDIESLRFGDRLKVEQTIDPGLLKVLMPPFSFEPLVENAVQHGLHSSPQAGRLHLVVRATGPWLEMSVSDEGQGVPSAEIEQLFFAERPRVHALVLLRRRLQGLFGRSFQLEVRSELAEGTTVTMRIPLRKRFFMPSQQILGHEFSGTVVEAGSEIKDYREGDRVAIQPYLRPEMITTQSAGGFNAGTRSANRQQIHIYEHESKNWQPKWHSFVRH